MRTDSSELANGVDGHRPDSNELENTVNSFIGTNKSRSNSIRSLEPKTRDLIPFVHR
ncbi:hypothetical protein U1Q18_030247, partial [Sarracenia purpurea var. burkii]